MMWLWEFIPPPVIFSQRSHSVVAPSRIIARIAAITTGSAFGHVSAHTWPRLRLSARAFVFGLVDVRL